MCLLEKLKVGIGMGEQEKSINLVPKLLNKVEQLLFLKRKEVGDILAKIDEWLEPDKLILLEGWARDGLTYEQIAKNMGIGLTTLKEWRQKESTISATLKKGREVVDFEVENALLKRALGYTIQIREQKVDKDGCIHDLVKDVHVPADTTAQIFWLKNRKKEQWRDKVEYSNVSSETNNQIQSIANLLNNPKPNRSEEDVQ